MAFLQQAMATGLPFDSESESLLSFHFSARAGAVFVVVTMICFAQGVGQALYMAANTTLISRRFTGTPHGVETKSLKFDCKVGKHQ